MLERLEFLARVAAFALRAGELFLEQSQIVSKAAQVLFLFGEFRLLLQPRLLIPVQLQIQRTIATPLEHAHEGQDEHAEHVEEL